MAVTVGSLYALIALGYTMVYGILKFINFAHSDVVVLGAWGSFFFAAALLPRMGFGTPLPWWAGGMALLFAMALCGLTGFLIERFAYRPLRGAPRLNVLITAIGVSLFLQNAGQLQFTLVRGDDTAQPPAPALRLPFGTQPQRMPTLLPDQDLLVIGEGQSTARLGSLDVVIIATALALMVLLDLLVRRTKFGMAMRAVSFNTDSAALMGVPVNRVISMTFVLGAVLAAAAGFLYVLKFPTVQQTAHPTWVLVGLKAFVAAVVGGIGNLRGAVLGGFLIAFAEQFGESYLQKYLGSGLKDVYVFSALILVLLVRPTGILGSPLREKV
ncbi:MAG: branched-chain amino acid ABC transporter permease [Phycisphaerales bacterium]|nr:branched-chain amino acid ABC transporter permease [Phycisphaerales bacterium]